jgi:hypothetical protein
MLAMAIYELLAAALNFDTIMHSSVTLVVIVQHMERKNQISICSHNQKALNNANFKTFPGVIAPKSIKQSKPCAC